MEFTNEKAKELLDVGTAQAQELMKNPPKVDELLVSLEEKLKEVPVLGETVSDLPVMIAMVKGYITGSYRAVSPKVVASIIAAFLYLVKKKDLINDKIPVLGIADDLAVITLALKLNEAELDAFKQFRDAGADTVKSVPETAEETAEETTEETAEEAGEVALEEKEKGMSRVNDFLTEAGTFFLATVDGDQPKVRPLGLHFEMDGKVLFGIGHVKDVYHQLQANPKTEIVACKSNGHWLRYTGKAVFETDPKYAAAALEIMPDLKAIYNEQTGNKMMVFHLEEATAVDIPMMGAGESLL